MSQASGHLGHSHDHGHDHHGHDHHHDHDHVRLGMVHAAESEERKVDLKILACLLGGMMLIAAVVARYVFEVSESGHYHSDFLAAIAALLLGVPIIWDALRGLLGFAHHHHDHAHAHDHSADGASHSHFEELVALAIIASFADGQYLECGAVAFFMLISSFIEHRTAVGARKSIESLIRITPTRAQLIGEDGEEQEIDAKELKPGDRVRIRPGDNIPGDGIIRNGQSTIDQANITGESVPVEKSIDDEVFSGTINETGVLEVEITRAGKDSTLGKVQELIIQAAGTRPAVVRLLDRYAGFYTPVVLMGAALVYFFTGDLSASIALLLLGCPCAVILAAPTAMVAALSAAARLGVLVKNVTDLEVARRASAIIFDKTGTLTVGKLSVTRLKPLDGTDGAELLRLCAAAEKGSKHPVAKAVVQMANKARLTLPEHTQFEEVAGRGVKATIENRQVIVGRETFLRDNGVTVDDIDITEGEGLSLLYVAVDGKVCGWIGLEDQTRRGAVHAMRELEEIGIKRRVMITGDRWSPARRVAREVNITDLEAEALPGDKLALVEQLKSKGHTVVVIGDGVNDGPALAAGDISIAMGAAGSDVAINSASIALMNNNLNRIPFLLKLSRNTINVVRQNLIGVAVYILFMLTLLVMGWLTPLGAAIGHGISSILVVFNSARLVREGENLEDHEPAAEQTTQPRRQVHVEPVRPAVT